MKHYAAFDIEIAKALPEGETDWKAHRPLGISCAAACFYSGDELIEHLWWDTPQMRKTQSIKMVEGLMAISEDGYTLLTWNGLGFDFDIVAEESGMYDECRELALNHVDMMFHFFCSNGYALGLDKASKGMGLPGKPEGMHGALAPELWAQKEYSTVLDYVQSDVKNTLELARLVMEYGVLEWVSSRGNPMSWSPESGEWLTVKEALGLPLPDTSWMTDPWPREKFTGWTEKSP